MIRIALVLSLILCGNWISAQDNCGCDGVDMSWLEEIRDNITEEILNPPVIPCGSSDGSIRQCQYLGQTVFSFIPTILPCDVGTRVVDCNGNFVFSYGGFCNGPCPGDDQVQFLENCEIIYSIPAYQSCDNSCSGTNAVLLDVGCAVTETNATQLCIPITTRNFANITQVQTGISWDPNLLSYTGINEIGLTGITLNEINAVNGLLLVLWALPANNPLFVLFDDFPLFEICFDVLGPDGSVATIDLVNQANFNIEIRDENGDLEPLCLESGTVSIQEDINENSLQVIFCMDSDIPTLGQWALICLSILFMIFGITSIKSKQIISQTA